MSVHEAWDALLTEVIYEAAMRGDVSASDTDATLALELGNRLHRLKAGTDVDSIVAELREELGGV